MESVFVNCILSPPPLDFVAKVWSIRPVRMDPIRDAPARSRDPPALTALLVGGLPPPGRSPERPRIRPPSTSTAFLDRVTPDGYKLSIRTEELVGQGRQHPDQSMDRKWRPDRNDGRQRARLHRRRPGSSDPRGRSKPRTADTAISPEVPGRGNRKSLERARKRRAERPPGTRSVRSRRRGRRMDDLRRDPSLSPRAPQYFSFRVRERRRPGMPPPLSPGLHAKVKDDEHWAGRLWFDAETFTPISAGPRSRRRHPGLRQGDRRSGRCRFIDACLPAPSPSSRSGSASTPVLPQARPQVVEEDYSEHVVRD